MSENGLQSISFHSESMSLFGSRGWEGKCVPDCIHTCAGMVHGWNITDVTPFAENFKCENGSNYGLKAKTLWRQSSGVFFLCVCLLSF